MINYPQEESIPRILTTLNLKTRINRKYYQQILCANSLIFLTYMIETIPDLKRSDYLVDIEYEPGMPYSDILRLAMKREENALKFYNDFSEKTGTPDHKRLFQVLAQEESKHKLKLETLLDDYLAELGD